MKIMKLSRAISRAVTPKCHGLIAALALIVTALAATRAQADLTIYSDRAASRLATAINLFKNKTGHNVTVVEGTYKELAAKLTEDANPVDLFITKDLIYLAELEGQSLLAPLTGSKTADRVAPYMRSSANTWVALTYRVRSAVYDPSRVESRELTTYADLATEKWRGRLCLRSATSSYTQALVAHLILVHGPAKAKNIVKGWVANQAAAPFANDTAIIQAVANGSCDVGLVNHYYLAGELSKNPSLPVAMAFLDQALTGAHSNGVGVAVLNRSPNPALAGEFVDILLSPDFQTEFSAAHFDYPALLGLQPTTLIKDWGTFSISPVGWDLIGAEAEAARRLMKEVGYE